MPAATSALQAEGVTDGASTTAADGSAALAEARRIAFDNLRIARAGGDPRPEAARNKGPTFRRVYEVATETRRKAWERKSTDARAGAVASRSTRSR